MLIVRRNPAWGRRVRVLKEQLRIWKKNKSQGCVSQHSDSKKSILRKTGQTRWKSCTLDFDRLRPSPSSEKLTSFASVPYLYALVSSHPRTFHWNSKVFHHLVSFNFSSSWCRKMKPFLMDQKCCVELSLVSSSAKESSTSFCWNRGGDGPSWQRSFTSPFEHGTTSGSCTNISWCLNLSKSSTYTPKSVKKPCTWDVKSCRPSPLLREIDSLRFCPYAFTRTSRNTV